MSTATPSTATRVELLCRATAERDLPPEARAQPTGEQDRVRLRPGHRQPLGLLDLRPELREPPAPDRCRVPTRCPRPRPDRRGSPAARTQPEVRVHSEESTTSRSQTSTSCSSSGFPHGGSPRQRQNVGRSEIRSGCTIDAGAWARLPPSRSSITSEQTSCETPGIAKHCIVTATSTPSRPLGSGKSRIVRDGWRSSRPASVRRAAAAHFGGAHAMWVITLVRRSGVPSAPSSWRSSSSCRSTSETTLNAASSSARRGGSARRRCAGPRFRPRSSGSSVGRAATRRRSSRRAPTARPPRPSG